MHTSAHGLCVCMALELSASSAHDIVPLIGRYKIFVSVACVLTFCCMSVGAFMCFRTLGMSLCPLNVTALFPGLFDMSGWCSMPARCFQTIYKVIHHLNIVSRTCSTNTHHNTFIMAILILCHKVFRISASPFNLLIHMLSRTSSFQVLGNHSLHWVPNTVWYVQGICVTI